MNKLLVQIKLQKIFLSCQLKFNHHHVPVSIEENSNDQLHRMTKWIRSHPKSQIIGDPSGGVKPRAFANFCLFSSFVSMVEPKRVCEALEDLFWIETMQGELLQFEINQVWTFVPLLECKTTIATKWVFINKKDEDGVVVRNKARLVAKEYCQKEGIDYEETFASIARLEQSS